MAGDPNGNLGALGGGMLREHAADHLLRRFNDWLSHSGGSGEGMPVRLRLRTDWAAEYYVRAVHRDFLVARARRAGEESGFDQMIFFAHIEVVIFVE